MGQEASRQRLLTGGTPCYRIQWEVMLPERMGGVGTGRPPQRERGGGRSWTANVKCCCIVGEAQGILAGDVNLLCLRRPLCPHPRPAAAKSLNRHPPEDAPKEPFGERGQGRDVCVILFLSLIWRHLVERKEAPLWSRTCHSAVFVQGRAPCRVGRSRGKSSVRHIRKQRHGGCCHSSTGFKRGSGPKGWVVNQAAVAINQRNSLLRDPPEGEDCQGD